jgi:hypothetical protein
MLIIRGVNVPAAIVENGKRNQWQKATFREADFKGLGSDTVALNVTSSRRMLLFLTHVQFRTVENFLFPDNCITSLRARIPSLAPQIQTNAVIPGRGAGRICLLSRERPNLMRASKMNAVKKGGCPLWLLSVVRLAELLRALYARCTQIKCYTRTG